LTFGLNAESKVNMDPSVRRGDEQHQRDFIMRLCSILAFMALAVAQSVAAQSTLKIASLAPDGSLWMKEMRAAGDAIAQASEGRVAIKFYPGGVMGNDATVLRKIRLGQLQGGAFTGSELSLVYKNAQLYSLPFLFSGYEQIDAVRPKVDPILVEGFANSGFRVVGISGVGFAYVMGSREISNREQLKQAKVWVPANDRIAELTFREGGIEPIPLPLGDVFTSLQTGLVDTVGNTAAGAIALQWHTKVSHLFDLPLSYVIGYVAIENKAFAKLSQADQALVIQAFGEAAKRIDAGNRKADAEARAVLQKQGVAFATPSEEEIAYWQGIGATITQRLVSEQALDASLLDAVRAALPPAAGDASQP
jgi:TRAP-type C4-dicarboxylate transport system substrate-binding protein